MRPSDFIELDDVDFAYDEGENSSDEEFEPTTTTLRTTVESDHYSNESASFEDDYDDENEINASKRLSNLPEYRLQFKGLTRGMCKAALRNCQGRPNDDEGLSCLIGNSILCLTWK